MIATHAHVAGDPPVIELRHLRRAFGSTQAVDDVSFTVPRGAVFGYIGPNGAGKTTSMRILSTLEIPDSGDAMVDGLSSVNDPDKVRRRLGFMPDAFGSYSATSCIEYLDFYARAHGLDGPDRTRQLRRVIDFTGLAEMADKPMNGLSKGMRQRLGLGRALVHDPSVLILDEPAAGLDPRARIELREMIGQLSSEGKTVLISSHILTELAEMCDHVGIIERGRLLAVGSVNDIRQVSTRRTLRIATRDDDAARRAEPILNGFGAVDDVVVDGRLIRGSFTGDAESQIELLKTLIVGDVPVAAYEVDETSLEDAFLRITQGRIQ